MHLTASQIAKFKDRGYLQLDISQQLGKEQLALWRSQLWRQFGVPEDNASCWPERRKLEGAVVSPRLFELPLVRTIVDQLSAGSFTVISPDDKPVCVFPGDETRELHPHLDGYSQRGWAGGFLLAATLYLTDVTRYSDGGNFTLWPRSHHASHRYFLQQPTRIDGSYMAEKAFQERGHSVIFGDDPTVEGCTPILGPAGTLVLWHGWMIHEGSHNFRSAPRLAIFAKYAHRAMRTPERWVLPSQWLRPDAPERHNDPRYDVPDDLWKYWALEVQLAKSSSKSIVESSSKSKL